MINFKTVLIICPTYDIKNVKPEKQLQIKIKKSFYVNNSDIGSLSYLPIRSCGKCVKIIQISQKSDCEGTFFLKLNIVFNPLSPHDASKHHFPSLKTILFSYNQRI